MPRRAWFRVRRGWRRSGRSGCCCRATRGPGQPGSSPRSWQKYCASMFRPLNASASSLVHSHATTAPIDFGRCAGVLDAELRHVLGDALGRDQAGLHVEAPDALVGELDREEPGHPLERALRHAVAHAPATFAGRLRGIGVARRRRDVHDRAAAALDHRREQELVQHERREHVAVELLLEQLDRRVEEAVHVAGTDVARRCARRRRRGPTSSSTLVAAAPSDAAVEQVALHDQRFAAVVAHERCRRRRLPGSGDMSEAFSVDECSRASPSSTVRAMIATSKPAFASATAVALPMPRLAPVTNATRWLMRDTPGTVTVSVSRPDRSNVPARSPVSDPPAITSRPFTNTCSIPCASA